MNNSTHINAPKSKGSVLHKIIHTPSITALHDHVIDDQSLVLLDLDNTVFTPDTGHVGHVWFKYMLMYGQSVGYDYAAAYAITQAEFMRRQHELRVIPAEAASIATIHALQQRGIPVIGLTGREQTIRDFTLRDLASLKLDFVASIPTPECLALDIPGYAAWHQGIGFCNNNDKGVVLDHLFAATSYRPQQIIFVDDVEKHVVSVQQSALRHNIPYVGLRYSLFDAVEAAYELDEASKLVFTPKG